MTLTVWRWVWVTDAHQSTKLNTPRTYIRGAPTKERRRRADAFSSAAAAWHFCRRRRRRRRQSAKLTWFAYAGDIFYHFMATIDKFCLSSVLFIFTLVPYLNYLHYHVHVRLQHRFFAYNFERVRIWSNAFTYSYSNQFLMFMFALYGCSPYSTSGYTWKIMKMEGTKH